MRQKGANQELESHLRDLDGIIPEEVDRRQFFKTVAAGTLSMGLAGCTGGNVEISGENATNDSGVSNDNSNDSGVSNGNSNGGEMVYRSAWSPNLSYSVAYMAQLQGMWDKQDIRPPTVKRGQGSGDTLNRVGNGQDTFGMASIDPQIASAQSDLKFKITGVARPRNTFALIYNENKVTSFDQISKDARIIATSGLAELTWSIYKEQLDLPDIQVEVIDDSAALSEFVRGNADAMWRGGYQYASAEQRIGDSFELGVKFLADVAPILGFTQIAYTPWLENNVEYTSSLLSGYSHALKWVCLNPEKTVDTMRNEVDTALQTGQREVQLETLKAGVIANNLTPTVRKNGFGYLDTDLIGTSAKVIAPLVDVETAPDPESLVDLRPQKEAELATMTNTEWDEVTEFAQPYVGFYGF